MIDYEYGHRALTHLQFQPQLPINGVKNRESTVGVREAVGSEPAAWPTSPPPTALKQVGRAKTQCKVPGAINPSGVLKPSLGINPGARPKSCFANCAIVVFWQVTSLESLGFESLGSFATTGASLQLERLEGSAFLSFGFAATSV